MTGLGFVDVFRLFDQDENPLVGGTIEQQVLEEMLVLG